MKNKKLIENLEAVIAALESDTVNYKWSNQESCNCGIVSQAILGLSQPALKICLVGMNHEWQSAHSNRNLETSAPTWTELTAHFCPIPGKPMNEIFSALMEGGLSRNDFAHLEYLNEENILSRSGISQNKVEIYDYVEKEVYESVPLVYEVVRKGKYYEDKDNLCEYLKSWVEILKEESGPSIEELTKQENELIAE